MGHYREFEGVKGVQGDFCGANLCITLKASLKIVPQLKGTGLTRLKDGQTNVAGQYCVFYRIFKG